ncbi:MAG: T9SS type A sorting domain-containing protein [Ignavibacteriales bacterium]|nr:T9SS type A sorting domain-containing protein [Ignavibacteriales bacterium]
MFLKFIQRIAIYFLILLLCAGRNISSAQTGGSSGKLYQFVKDNPAIKITGWGQGISRWESDAVPYFEAVNNKPVIYSSYLALADFRQSSNETITEQLKTISEGWKDASNNITYRFIPLIGMGAVSFDFNTRNKIISDGFFNELGITFELMQKYGINEATYSLNIFQTFLNKPELWDTVRSNLLLKGYDVENIDLEQLVKNGDDNSKLVLFNLRDSILVNANTTLLNQGISFSDLEIMNGAFDQEIIKLADKIKEINSPILIRLMYESYGGSSRPTIYSAQTYKQAWIHFVNLLRANGADNTEFIFHPLVSFEPILEKWYPGDEYIDWIGTSFFSYDGNLDFWKTENEFAVKHNKPYLLAESAPVDQKFRPSNTLHPLVWNEWFTPYFNFIKDNGNTKLFVYINIDWSSSGSFSDWGDTRIEQSTSLVSLYENELNNSEYVDNLKFWSLYTTSVENESELPNEFKLSQNYPNPFNPSTIIEYSIPATPSAPSLSHAVGQIKTGGGFVTLKVYDALGREITTLVNEVQNPGNYSVTFGGETNRTFSLPSGVYFYKLNYGNNSITKKMILLR